VIRVLEITINAMAKPLQVGVVNPMHEVSLYAHPLRNSAATLCFNLGEDQIPENQAPAFLEILGRDTMKWRRSNTDRRIDPYQMT
jgi:hypothetical protein